MYLKPLPKEILELIDFRDSMANDCLGMDREAKLQSLNWGFEIKDVVQPIFMQYSRKDEEVPFAAVLKTSELLPNCKLHVLNDLPNVSKENTVRIFQ